jgi:enamine deaminase RidA (YjgF/YER057c/UK114 family)
MERRNITGKGMEKPRGYEDAVLCDGAQAILWLGGHVAFDPNRTLLHPGDLVAQTRVTLANLKATLAAAGLDPSHLVKLTIHVTDVAAYRAKLSEIGQIWREALGKTYPAMTLIGVTALMEPGAVIEIDGIAAK